MERLSDKAIEIINVLHTERLDYETEYIPLIEATNRLAELEDKLESGQLKEIKYPCNVGDKVYVICSQTSNDKNLYIREDVCNELRVTKNEAGCYWLWIAFKGGWSVFEWLFDRVFHKPEEAEARLKELKEQNNG